MTTEAHRRLSAHSRKSASQASSEPRTKGHISTLHIWRARRPLVACRAAVYGALVPASQFVPNGASDGKKKSLGRANAAKFLKALCQYPGSAARIQEAQQHILECACDIAIPEQAKDHYGNDIIAGRAPRPRVLDMFAGGGAIPLEAARLGCESYAVELNPVAHLIELCTVTFPQQFGPELADDVEKWGRKVLDATQKNVATLRTRISRRREARAVEHHQLDALETPPAARRFPFHSCLLLDSHCTLSEAGLPG